ncbi:hypothetical protein Taro_052328 [Colocasia esculenta]|uniref:Uncharacterized protein n=1 Tax=Colocasia esculenta TaxID=4460 RepID=A0A843XJW8_COLES|nr:hypothetical protein [Colocasia esculenta]
MVDCQRKTVRFEIPRAPVLCFRGGFPCVGVPPFAIVSKPTVESTVDLRQRDQSKEETTAFWRPNGLKRDPSERKWPQRRGPGVEGVKFGGETSDVEEGEKDGEEVRVAIDDGDAASGSAHGTGEGSEEGVGREGRRGGGAVTSGGGGSATALLVAAASSPLAGVASPLHAVSRLPHWSTAIWCVVLCYPPHSCPVEEVNLEEHVFLSCDGPFRFLWTFSKRLMILKLLLDSQWSLNNNMLIGALPDAFQSLTGLINLDLSFNSLSSQLPPSMESLSSLTTLHIKKKSTVWCPTVIPRTCAPALHPPMGAATSSPQAHPILEAITTLRCCEDFSLERLGLLGDFALKFDIHDFSKNEEKPQVLHSDYHFLLPNICHDYFIPKIDRCLNCLNKRWIFFNKHLFVSNMHSIF